MRVCIDGRGLAGNRTGAGKALGFLLDRLRADVPRHEYVVVAPPGDRRWRLPRQLVWEQVELPRRARRLGGHVLHAPGGTSAPIVHGIPVVMTVHDIAPTRCPALLPGWRGRWYWARWVPLTARRADAVLVPSEATRRDLVEVAGVRPERIHVVPWGVAIEPGRAPTEADVEEIRLRHGLPRRYLLYVGTVDRRKDFASLLGALGRLPADVALVVAGTVIAGRTDFERRISDGGLERRVRRLGYVPERELRPLYAGAAAFVYPSRYEGFGLPVLEAMACGTPVVTYNATALPEVAGDAALLVDPPFTADRLGAALGRLLEDVALAEELRSRGIERAARFDWRETARLTARVWEQVAAR